MGLVHAVCYFGRRRQLSNAFNTNTALKANSNFALVDRAVHSLHGVDVKPGVC